MIDLNGRKIIQFSINPVVMEKNNYKDVYKNILTALCDDGSMWTLNMSEEAPRWIRLKELG